MEKSANVTGILWGLNEDYVLTAAVITSERIVQDAFHIYVDDELELAFEGLRAFLRRWGVKQLYVEDLSGLEDIKRRVDGPRSIQSSAWKRKIKACAKFQSRLPGLRLKMTLLNSTVEAYSQCKCGWKLFRFPPPPHCRNPKCPNFLPSTLSIRRSG